jgi:hypothetical protein
MEMINDFCQVIDCTYKGERYSVRNNGGVLRHPNVGKRVRPNDNQWTFGKINKDSGYMEIASVPIHRIVATAFHGEPPTNGHVVDHIDTNKGNNRPENLRWVTRLENILLNPITAKRIATVCGSVEAFLADPSKYYENFQEPNYKWMRTVSVQEAQRCYESLLAWAMNDILPSGGSLDEWIFNRNILQKQRVEAVLPPPELIKAKTLNAAQRNWRTASEFPCCPQQYTDDPIKTYAEKLISGSIFCRNEIYFSLVSKRALSKDQKSIYVISECEDGIKPWALAKITFENEMFVHTSLGTFFQQDGAEKQYTLAQGLEWLGGDTFDDNC